MPSFRITGSPVSIDVFDVVGVDGKEEGFIQHTGLSETSLSLDTGKIAVIDMGPPLHGDGVYSDVHAIGHAALTDDEQQKIKAYVDRHAGEHSIFRQISKRDLLRHAAEMYCIHPPATPFCEADGRYARMRFSCAGFVFETYKKARIALVDSDALPMVDLSAIKAAYPLEARLMDNEIVSAAELGLVGEGPWPVLLCGYLLHALDRDPETIRNKPYVPNADDRYFRMASFKVT